MRIERSATVGLTDPLEEDRPTVRPQLFSPLLPIPGIKRYRMRQPGWLLSSSAQ